MQRVVIFAVGSPILVDVEESLRRAGVSVCAGVRNRPGETFLSDLRLAVVPDALTDDMKALPYLGPLTTPGNRLEAVREAQALGFRQAFNLIDPTAAVPHVIDFQGGFYVGAGCSLGAASSLGEFVFINRGASIGHHVRFQRFVSIGPGAVVAGQVKIGQGSFVGAGAVLLPKVTIGHNAVVGAGAVVTRDVPDHCQVGGNPARVIRTDIAGYADKTVE